MTTEEKCKKFAKVLESIASKLRDPNIGVPIWDKDNFMVQSFVSSAHMFLRTARAFEDSVPSKNKHNNTKDKDLLDNWPDIIQ